MGQETYLIDRGNQDGKQLIPINGKALRTECLMKIGNPKKRRTFKDKLDVKTQTSFIRVTGESPDLGCRPTNP